MESAAFADGKTDISETETVKIRNIAINVAVLFLDIFLFSLNFVKTRNMYTTDVYINLVKKAAKPLFPRERKGLLGHCIQNLRRKEKCQRCCCNVEFFAEPSQPLMFLHFTTVLMFDPEKMGERLFGFRIVLIVF